MNCLTCNGQVLNRSKKKPAKESLKPKNRFCSHPCFIAYYQREDVLQNRFWARVKLRSFGSPFLLAFGCWTKKGGGARQAYEYLNGLLPPGFQINHHCDNPPCVNPFHVYAGSQKENMKDKVDRGRHDGPHSEKHHWSKLSNEQVLNIRAAWTNDCDAIPQLAKDYGVSTMTIFRIVTRETWKHV